MTKYKISRLNPLIWAVLALLWMAIVAALFLPYGEKLPIIGEKATDELILVGLALNLLIVVYMVKSAIKRDFDIFEPIFFLALLLLLIFVLRPIQILLDFDKRVYLLYDDSAIIAKGLMFGALGNVAFLFGYKRRVAEKLARKVPVFQTNWSAGRVMLLSIVYTIIGVGGFSYSLLRSGGIESFVSSLQGRQLIMESSSYAFAALLNLVYIGSTILAAYYFRTKRLKGLFYAAVPFSFFLGLLQGGRAIVLVYFVSILVLYYYSRIARRGREGRFFLTTAIIFIIAVVFIVQLGAYRTRLERGTIAAGRNSSLGWYGTSFLQEFNQFDWFAIVLKNTPTVLPYQYGKTLLEYFVQFVPRMFWAGKPLPIEYRVTNLLANYQSGSPFTIVGEMYINFGLAGILFGMIILGIFARTAYEYMKQNPSNSAAILLYSCFYANLTHFYTRSFAPMMFFFTIYILPALVAFMIIGKRRVLRNRLTPIDGEVRVS